MIGVLIFIVALLVVPIRLWFIAGYVLAVGLLVGAFAFGLGAVLLALKAVI